MHKLDSIEVYLSYQQAALRWRQAAYLKVDKARLDREQ